MAVTLGEADPDPPGEMSIKDWITIPQDNFSPDHARETPILRAPLTPISNRASPVLLSSTKEANALLADYYRRDDTGSKRALAEPHQSAQGSPVPSIADQKDDRCDVDSIVWTGGVEKIEGFPEQIKTILNFQLRQMDIMEHDRRMIPMDITPLTLDQAINERNAVYSYLRQIKVPPCLQQPAEQASQFPFEETAIFPIFKALVEAASTEPPHPDGPKYLYDLACLSPPPIDRVIEKQLGETHIDVPEQCVHISRVYCQAPHFDCSRYAIPDERGILRGCCSFMLAGRGPRKKWILPLMIHTGPAHFGDSKILTEMRSARPAVDSVHKALEENIVRKQERQMAAEVARFGDHPQGSFWQSR